MNILEINHIGKRTDIHITLVTCIQNYRYRRAGISQDPRSLGAYPPIESALNHETRVVGLADISRIKYHPKSMMPVINYLNWMTA
jgi:hypothetical protein